MVGFAGRGRTVVGERAINCQPMINDVKRLIGKPYARAVEEGAMKEMEFTVSEAANGRCQIEVPGRDPCLVESITSYVLDAMRKTAE